MNFFTRLKVSLFQFKNYHQLVGAGAKKAFAYMGIISLVFGLLTACITLPTISDMFNSADTVIDEKFSGLNIEKGILRSDFKDPVVFEDEMFLFAVDPSNKIDLNDDKYQKYNDDEAMVIIFGRKSIFLKEGKDFFNVTYKDISKEGIPIEAFTSDILKQFFSVLKGLFMLIILMMPLFDFIAYLFIAFIISIVMIIVCSIVKLDLKYKELFVVSVYALTWNRILVETFSILKLGELVDNLFILEGASIFIPLILIIIGYKKKRNTIEQEIVSVE